MKKRQIDLSNRLQKKQKNWLIKQSLYLGVGLLTLAIFTGVIWLGLPWHWQLFLRWILRQGQITEIPPRLHKPLSDLCYTASRGGYVNSYQSSPEIAYSLGKFRCRSSPDGDRWLIEDSYQFDNLREAAAGSPLAILIVYFSGTDYAYGIKTSIPKN